MNEFNSIKLSQVKFLPGVILGEIHDQLTQVEKHVFEACVEAECDSVQDRLKESAIQSKRLLRYNLGAALAVPVATLGLVAGGVSSPLVVGAMAATTTFFLVEGIKSGFKQLRQENQSVENNPYCLPAHEFSTSQQLLNVIAGKARYGTLSDRSMMSRFEGMIEQSKAGGLTQIVHQVSFFRDKITEKAQQSAQSLRDLVSLSLAKIPGFFDFPVVYGAANSSIASDIVGSFLSENLMALPSNENNLNKRINTLSSIIPNRSAEKSFKIPSLLCTEDQGFVVNPIGPMLHYGAYTLPDKDRKNLQITLNVFDQCHQALKMVEIDHSNKKGINGLSANLLRVLKMEHIHSIENYVEIRNDLAKNSFDVSEFDQKAIDLGMAINLPNDSYSSEPKVNKKLSSPSFGLGM